MTVTVVNLRQTKKADFICDRTTALGNPFIMRHEGEREHVCRQYEQYFYNNLNPDNAPVEFLEYLDTILQAAKQRDITLGCWCKPRKCHCDTIKQYIDSQISDNTSSNSTGHWTDAIITAVDNDPRSK